jgi:hypothetical protein
MIFSAYDVAEPLKNNEEYAFGINPKRTAAELRALADQIDAMVPKLVMQKVTVKEEADEDDFPMTTVTMVYYDASLKQKRIDKYWEKENAKS